jgi:transcriptional regulator with XRE-family HTH domain
MRTRNGGEELITDTTKMLRALRDEGGMTTADIMEAVNTSSIEQVRRWLRGDSQPAASRREIITNLFTEKIGEEK